MGEHRWSVLVCLEKGCECEGRREGEGIPDGCPYKILHLVDDRRVGFREMPRRSGKTTMLVRLANDLAETTGMPVYYVCSIMDVASSVKRTQVVDKRVKFASVGMVRNGWMRGMPRGLVLMDEVRPEERKELEPEMRFHHLVAGYWTG